MNDKMTARQPGPETAPELAGLPDANLHACTQPRPVCEKERHESVCITITAGQEENTSEPPATAERSQQSVFTDGKERLLTERRKSFQPQFITHTRTRHCLNKPKGYLWLGLARINTKGALH